MQLIGLAGNATVGKDTFYKFLYEINNKFCRFAFADKLKSEVYEVLLNNFHLNVFSNKDKILARDFLVAWGDLRRKQSKGQYWINELTKVIEKCSNKDNIISVITDVRFATFKYDELDFIKQNGILVYIDKVDRIEAEYISPANEKEAYNNPILKNNADYLFEWQDCGGNESLIKERYFLKIKEFVEWYQNKTKNKIL